LHQHTRRAVDCAAVALTSGERISTRRRRSIALPSAVLTRDIFVVGLDGLIVIDAGAGAIARPMKREECITYALRVGGARIVMIDFGLKAAELPPRRIAMHGLDAMTGIGNLFLNGIHHLHRYAHPLAVADDAVRVIVIVIVAHGRYPSLWGHLFHACLIMCSIKRARSHAWCPSGSPGSSSSQPE